MNILYLGNSITLHAPAPEIGWHGEWGMAASAPENDYVHVLNRLISQTGKFVAYKAENIAFVEREPERFCVDSFEKYVKFTPDLIVIRIGENITSKKAEPFGKAGRNGRKIRQSCASAGYAMASRRCVYACRCGVSSFR